MLRHAASSAHKQSQKAAGQGACLHASLTLTIYDEQREREIRSISSLLMQE